MSDAVDAAALYKKKPEEGDEEDKRKWKTSYAECDSEEQFDTSGLAVFYCVCCGNFAMISAMDLTKLPKRRTDGSLVVDEKVVKGMKGMVLGETKLLKREKGMEKQ